MRLNFVKEEKRITRLLLRTRIPLPIRLEILTAYRNFIELRKHPCYSTSNVAEFYSIGTFLHNCINSNCFIERRFWEIRERYGIFRFSDRYHKILGEL